MDEMSVYTLNGVPYEVTDKKARSATLATIPSDAEHRTVSDSEKEKWNKRDVTVYSGAGFILNTDGGTAIGKGVISGVGYPDGTIALNYTIYITQAGSVLGATRSGINSALLRNLGFPNITPMYGGVWTMYDTNGNIYKSSDPSVTNPNGYGGVHETVGEFWRLARMYTDDGQVAGMGDTTYIQGFRLVGTCYGRF